MPIVCYPDEVLFLLLFLLLNLIKREITQTNIYYTGIYCLRFLDELQIWLSFDSCLQDHTIFSDFFACGRENII